MTITLSELPAVLTKKADDYKALLANLSAPLTVTPETAGPLLLGAICANDTEMAAYLLRGLFPHAEKLMPMRLGLCESLGDCCRRTAAPHTIVHDAAHVALPATSRYSLSYTYQTEASILAEIQGARWVPGSDYVITADDTVLDDVIYQPVSVPNGRRPHAHFRDMNLIGYYRPDREILIEGDVFYLSSPVENQFGHWLIDFLPRLYGLSRLGRAMKIAVPATLNAKQIETLALFGISEFDLIRCVDDATYRFQRLHLYKPGTAMPPNPAHVAYVRAHLAPKPEKPVAGHRFYLERGSVATRLVHNTEAFDRLLSDNNFQRLIVEKLTVAEQRAALRNAEVLLGTFGSNLLALYFAPPGCTVIGMTHEPDADPTIPHTCAMLGMKHQFLESRDAGQSAKWSHRKDRDVSVDCDELQRRLSEL